MEMGAGAGAGAGVSVGAEVKAEALARAQAGQATLAGMTVRSLDEKTAQMEVGAGGKTFATGVNSDGSFFIAETKEGAYKVLLSVDESGHVSARTPVLQVGSLESLDGFKVGGVDQWKLHSYTSFSQPEDVSKWKAAGSIPATTGLMTSKCENTAMLGGPAIFDRDGSIAREFTALPGHKQLRVQGTFHFIDQWLGDHGWIKLSGNDLTKLEYVEESYVTQHHIIPPLYTFYTPLLPHMHLRAPIIHVYTPYTHLYTPLNTLNTP